MGTVRLNIDELLIKKGKTRYWLVKKMDSNYTAINKMFKNESSGIMFDTIYKLCKLLECSPNELFIFIED